MNASGPLATCSTHAYRRQRGLPERDPADRVGQPSGFGRFGIVDRGEDWVLCHECGKRFAALPAHLRHSHGLTVAQFRARHGLAATDATMSLDVLRRLGDAARARVGTAAWRLFQERRDAALAMSQRKAAQASTPGGRARLGKPGRSLGKGPRRDDSRWVDCLAAAVAFHQSRGRWPTRASSDPGELMLARWVDAQRRLHRNGRLAPDRRQRLTQVAGWDFAPGRGRRVRLPVGDG